MCSFYQDQSLLRSDILKDTVSAWSMTLLFAYPLWSGMVRVERWKIVSCHPEQNKPLEPDPGGGTPASTAFLNLSLGIEQADLDLHPIKEALYQLIGSQDQLQDITVVYFGITEQL